MKWGDFMSLHDTIGDRIRDLRQRKRIKQRDLAKHLSVTGSTISNWENGRRMPSLEELRRIAAYFDVPFSIFGDVPEADRPLNTSNSFGKQVIAISPQAVLEIHEWLMPFGAVFIAFLGLWFEGFFRFFVLFFGWFLGLAVLIRLAILASDRRKNATHSIEIATHERVGWKLVSYAVPFANFLSQATIGMFISQVILYVIWIIWLVQVFGNTIVISGWLTFTTVHLVFHYFQMKRLFKAFIQVDDDVLVHKEHFSLSPVLAYVSAVFGLALFTITFFIELLEQAWVFGIFFLLSSLLAALVLWLLISCLKTLEITIKSDSLDSKGRV